MTDVALNQQTSSSGLADTSSCACLNLTTCTGLSTQAIGLHGAEAWLNFGRDVVA